MKTRIIQYNLDYVHILSFREEYKNAVIPYFGLDNLRYGIDNENTINESIRLLYNQEHMAIAFRKEGLTIVYEGEEKDLKNQNGVMKLFWDLFERAQKFKGFRKTVKHSVILKAVEIMDKDKMVDILKNPKYFNVNPFGQMSDFGCIYEFNNNDRFCKFEFGNYSEKDIETHDLSPFRTTENSDLFDGNTGLMCHAEVREDLNNITFSKFKSLLNEAEDIIKRYKI